MRYCFTQIQVLVLLVRSAAAGPISNNAGLVIRDEPAWANGTNPDCRSFVVPVEGDYCDKIAKTAGITTKWFMDQNPQINKNCKNLWQRTKYCIAPPNGQRGKDQIFPIDAFVEEAGNIESDNKDSGIPLPGIGRGVAFHNKSPNDICYAFEVARDSAVLGDLPTSATCQVGLVSYNGLIVPAGQWRFHSLSSGFQGAITAVTNNALGARHEFAFVSGRPPGAFYDVDYEYGLSGSTLQPYDGRPFLDGRSSRVGEADFLTKINQSFKELSAEEQQVLLTESGEQYIKEGPNGDLTWVCIRFLHLTTHLSRRLITQPSQRLTTF